MKKIILILVSGFVLSMGGCKGCGNNSDKSFSLQVASEEKELFLSQKTKPKAQSL
jgi:hypothetical protein